MTPRATLLYLLIVALSVLAFAFVVPPWGFAIPADYLEPVPAETPVQFMDTPRGQGLRPGVQTLMWTIQPARRQERGELL